VSPIAASYKQGFFLPQNLVSAISGTQLDTRELALLEQRPKQSGWRERPGRGEAKLPWAFAWGQRHVAFSLRRVVSAFLADISSEAFACGGVGEQELEKYGRRPSTPLAMRCQELRRYDLTDLLEQAPTGKGL
jgi:hypothetical protein